MPAYFTLFFPIPFGGPDKSHRRFTYYFDDDYGFCFGPCGWVAPPPGSKYNYDLAIFYGGMGDSDYLDCRCSRWDVSDYSIIIETWLKKDDIQTLLSNIVPGAVGELYKILGKPLYYDKTWTAGNTIKFLPTPSSNHMQDSNLKNMSDETVAYPKNITL